MIGRYLLSGHAKFLKTFFASNTPTGGTGSTQNWNTKITGEPGSVVGFQVEVYSASQMSAVLQIDGTPYVLNDTFSKTLDGTGQYTLAWFMDVGTTTPGNGFAVRIYVISTTIGTIGSPDNQQNDIVI